MPTIFTDDCTRPALEVWKAVEAETPGRIATRVADNGSSYRRCSVGVNDKPVIWAIEGAVSPGSGSRTEMGRNSLKYAPFLYEEGKTYTTVLRVRLPRHFPIAATRFQTLAQWKQTGISGLPPVFALRAWKNRWELVHTRPDGGQVLLWTGPPVLGVWERFALNVTYRADDQGSIQLRRGAAMPTQVWRTNTLIGAPSHLRRGIYHDPEGAPATTVVDHGRCEVVLV